MFKYKKISPNRLINLIESKDKKLREKDKELDERDEIIAELDALWTSPKAREYRHQGERGRKLAYKLELLHIIMTTAEDLHANTGCQIGEFSWMLAHFRKFILDNKDKMLLFDLESSEQESDAVNRCLLAPEHALLMGLMRKRINNIQEYLASLFGIDQTTVCRYLKIVDDILEQILPTARNVSDIIQSDEKTKQIQKTLGRVLLIDGTHVPVQRSGDSKQRKRSYSDKKEQFTFNTEIITNTKGIIIYQTKSYLGGNHDFGIFKKESSTISNILKSLTGSNDTKLYSEKGFLGISDFLCDNIQSMQSKKRSENHPLTKREQAKNRQINKIRVKVERVMGDIKSHARMVDAYDGTLEEFETEFNVVTGLANLHAMWEKTSRWKKGMPPPPWITYFDQME